MNYITKTCPSCGRNFTVLRGIEKKAIYCTIKCLLKAQTKPKSRKLASAPV